MRTKINKQLNMQRNIILVLLVLFVFVFSATVTFALYSRIVQDSISIRFSNPVNVFVLTNDQNITDIGGTTGLIEGVVYPGTQLDLKLGFEIGSLTEQNKLSSPGYIRVKINFTSDAVPNNDGTLLSAGLVQIMPQNRQGQDSINLSKWYLVDFSATGDMSDMWWVYGETIDTTTLAKGVENGTRDNFIDGLIIINTDLDNTYANKEIEIDFTVSAIQTMHIINPLLNLTPLLNSNEEQVFIDNFFYSDNLVAKTYIPVYTNATWGVLSNP